MKRHFAVIGMGRFGSSVSSTLHNAGMEVIAVDQSEDLIEDFEGSYTYGFIADATDEKSLRSVGVQNVDVAVVAIGSDIQSSILAVLNLKEIGVPYIVAKALDPKHGKVLERVGADRVVYPERDMGQRVANSILSPNVLDIIGLESDYSIEEIKAPVFMKDKSLVDLNLRAKHGINVIGIKRNKQMNIMPLPTEVIEEADLLIIMGHNKDLKKFSELT